MKKFKSAIALLLVFALLLTVGACGKGDDTDTTLDVDVEEEGEYYDETPEDNYVDVPVEPVDTLPVEGTTGGVQTTHPQITVPSTNTLTSVSATQSSTPTKPIQNQGQTQNQNPNETHNKPQNQAPTAATTQSQSTTGVKSVVYEDGKLTHIVYYPAKLETGKQKYPVVAWANGTGCNYTWYEGLLEKLAEGGYVVIANDETMAADGTAQISSIDFILNESKNSSSVFYKKINTEKIATAGHSQGGRSAVNAAAADSRIDCVLSLAGSNYVEEAEKLSTPVFFIAGTNDMMVSPKKWIVTAYNACTGPAVYASLDGAIHTTCCTNPQSYSGYAIEWFDLWLKNDKSAKSMFVSGGTLSKDADWVDFACKGL